MSVDKSQSEEEIPEVKELREKFLIIAKISDPLTREYQFALLEKEAEKIGLSAETYRRLFETYLRDNQFIPQYPQKFWVLKEWSNWFSKFTYPKKLLFKKGWILILEKGVLISLIFAVFKYYWEAPQREKQANYQTLQVWFMVSSAIEKKATGGIIIGLEHLNKNGEMLRNLNLDNVDASGINLENGKLSNVNFQNSQLGCQKKICSNFKKANLYQSNFYDAYLSKIDFRETNLIDANLQKAYLEQAKFQNAYLYEANLEEAELKGAKFQGADLEKTNLKDAIMCGDVFDQATSSKKYICANFIGAKNLTAEQVKSAKNWEKACYDRELRIKLNLPPENPDDCQDKLK